MSTAAVSAVIDERASDNVCLTLEKSRSTEILTPGIARMSRETRAMKGSGVSEMIDHYFLLNLKSATAYDPDDPCRKDRQSIPEQAFAASDPTPYYSVVIAMCSHILKSTSARIISYLIQFVTEGKYEYLKRSQKRWKMQKSRKKNQIFPSAPLRTAGPQSWGWKWVEGALPTYLGHEEG
ncbi:hypothetical protein B0H12DRAFT_1217832 [Mycena haematopus]|nr:hypothetical protein B0H12DRAFT_1217832 [Mycena haematopus]